MSAWLPRVTAAAGCGGTGRELARFGDLAVLDAILIGPIGPPGADDAGHGVRGRTRLATSPSGLVHTPAPTLRVEHVVEDLLPWFRARGLPVVCAVRGGTVGAVVEVLRGLRGSLDLTTVVAVELDLTTDREETGAAGVLGPSDPVGPWSADPQACLKLLAAAREQLPRDLLLTAKVAGECPDPLATSRAAVGGGARALVLSGSVPAVGPVPTAGAPGAGPREPHPVVAPPRQHLVGPAIGPVTLGLIARLRAAMAAGRVPDVPVVAVGGVHDVGSALQARAAGATGVQLGTGLLADPQTMWDVHEALTTAPPPPPVFDTID